MNKPTGAVVGQQPFGGAKSFGNGMTKQVYAKLT